jgi:hypothetical protein
VWSGFIWLRMGSRWEFSWPAGKLRISEEKDSKGLWRRCVTLGVIDFLGLYIVRYSKEQFASSSHMHSPYYPWG